MPRSCRIWSAAWLVAPLAASATMPAFTRVGVVAVQLVLEGCRDQNVAIQFQQVLDW